MPMTKSEIPLEKLVELAGKGDHACFKAIYERTSNHLFGIALRLLRNRDAAEEILQEAYVSVWNNARNYSSEVDGRSYSAMSWLITIVRNKSLDALRARGRRREFEVPIITSDDEWQTSDFDGTDDMSALDMFEKATEAVNVTCCIASLDAKQRQCIALAFYQGYSHSEVAAQLGVPLGSAKAWVRRGLIKLKGCLAAAGVES